ncbi:hypothetical protein [Brasilonema bromeliae]|uniref:hypothetical protein n=1 Tax=Brasilonema bromeliae TaxID=383615 RepID=UPI00145CEBEC|nr:hypothetical protein [Brasilonema bromeliae]
MPTQNLDILDYCPSCGGYNFIESLEPETSLHYGRLTCNECGRFVKWLRKPRKTPDISVARLLNSTGLEPWEKKFLKAVVCRNLTKAEVIVVQAIANKVNPATVGRGSG